MTPSAAPPDPMRRCRTLALRATVTADLAALARVLRAGGRAERLVAATARSGAGPPGDSAAAGSGMERRTEQVWWAAPSRWRDDVTWPNGQTVVQVVRGGASLVYMSVLGEMYTSEPVAASDGWVTVPPPRGTVFLPTLESRLGEQPLLRPPFPASHWAFTEGQPTAYLGRPCRRVHAVRRPGHRASAKSDQIDMSGYWGGVDEYECLVDDGLGLTVRLTGLADGVPVATYAADDVQVDVALPDEIFEFRPPPGTQVARVVRRS